MPIGGFDPLGVGFDIEASRASGARPAVGGINAGHLTSRDPRTGQVLKGLAHPTFELAIQADVRLGFKPFRSKKSGKFFTFRNTPDSREFEAIEPAALLEMSRKRRRELAL